MYSELMMREQGFDADPRFRLIMHTDAIWRACRIILDVRMHRGEMASTRRPTSSSSRPASSARNAHAEVQWYTYRPTYPAVLPAGPDAAPRPARRRAATPWRRASASRASTTRCCGTARSRSASTAGCSPARAIRLGAPDRIVQVIPAIDLEGGRSRLVYWPGAAAGVGAPTDRPDRIAERFVALGARLIHLVDFDGARSGAPANLEAVGSIAARIAVPLQVAGGVDSADAIRLAFAAGATRVVLDDGHRRPAGRAARLPGGRRRLAGRRPRSRDPSDWPPSRGGELRRRRSTGSSASWSAPASHASS